MLAAWNLEAPHDDPRPLPKKQIPAELHRPPLPVVRSPLHEQQRRTDEDPEEPCCAPIRRDRLQHLPRVRRPPAVAVAQKVVERAVERFVQQAREF